MKKLSKLQIKSAKIMKNEELVTLRGGDGYGGSCCWCFGQGGELIGAMAALDAQDCWTSCTLLGGPGFWLC